MPSAQQLLALIKSHVRGDNERFYSLALQLAASEAKKGHSLVAEQLRDLLEQAKSPRPRIAESHGPVPVPSVRTDLASLISVAYPSIRLNHMVLREDLLGQLKRIVYEQRQRGKLSGHGLKPRRKILLMGPPGSGKTMTAGALAGELGLPLLSVLLHGVITKFMGETASKLRLVFDAMSEMRGVYLFDEIDAIGTKRTKDNDVGEARRILNSFLQFMEQDQSESLIVATTNHEELLDRALFRRFDVILRYDLPSPELAVSAIKGRLHGFDTSNVSWSEVATAASGLSHAEIIGAAEDAARNAILDRGPEIRTGDLVASLKQKRDRS
ncbi:MAG: ATP-binding protein [Terriglobales bacterium]